MKLTAVVFPANFKPTERLTKEEKELNKLILKLWVHLQGINYYEYEKYKAMTFWDRRGLEQDRETFKRVADEIRQKFQGRKDGKVVVIFERDKEAPFAVIRKLLVEDGLLKISVGGKKYTVQPDAMEDYKKTVRFGVFKVITSGGLIK